MSKELDHIIKNMQGSIENRLKAAYNLGRNDGYEAGIHELEAYHMGYQQGREDSLTEKHWGKKSEKSCNTCGNDYLTCDVDKCRNGDTRLLWTPKQTEKIKVGDEVIYPNGDKGIVIRSANFGQTFSVLNINEGWTTRRELKEITKTGRYFPQISEVLKQMQEDKKE